MKEYLLEAIDEFKINYSKKASTPAAIHLFEVNDNKPMLPKDKQLIFHRTTAKLLFVSKRGRPDIQVAVAFLTTRVTKSNEDDWKKLARLMRYIHGTVDTMLTLLADEFNVIKW